MKINIKKLIICLFIPLAVGALSSLVTNRAMDAFNTLEKPPLSPPDIVFPIVWTILYILMGIASYKVAVTPAPNTQKDTALAIYALQLVFNFFWSVIFFNMQSFLFAFIWLVALWLLILWTIVRFYRINKCAGLLLIPYLLWVTFAGYLNFGIYLLNG